MRWPFGSAHELAVDAAHDARRAQDRRRWRSPRRPAPSASASPTRPWPIGRLPIEEPEYLSTRQHEAALLAGQVDAGRACRSRTCAPSSRSAACPSRRPILIAPTLLDWARICAVRQRLGAARVRLADRAVGDLDLRRQVERRVGRDRAVLQRARDGERLERRARLVGVADGAVLRGVAGRRRRRVGVDARPVGHREDLAGARVHDDRRRALGPVGLRRRRRARARPCPGSRRRSSARGARRAWRASCRGSRATGRGRP